MYKYFSVLLILFFSNLFAQDCNLSLSGYVIDLHDNSLLENATVKILGEEIYAVSDAKGFYSFKNLCPGKYQIEVNHIQCDPLIKTIEISKTQKLNFNLEHHLESLNEVLLKGELYNSTDKTTISTKISEETIDQFSGQTFGDALESVAGVSTLSTGSTISKPIIHGLHSSRILIMNNGVRLEDQQWGAEHAPNIDVNNISNITVVKGSSALQYGGDAVGGVIITQPKKAPLLDTLMGKVIAGGMTNGRGGSLATNFIKSYKSGFNIRAQGSLKKLGDAEAADYILSNTGVNEQNFALGLGLNKINYGFDLTYSRFNTEIGILRASHTGNSEEFANAINADRPNVINPFTYDINAPKQEVTHQILKARFFKNISNFGKFNLQYDYQNNRRFEFDIRRGDDRDVPSVDLELQTHSILVDAVYDTKDNYELKFGLVGRYQNNFPNPNTGVRRFIPDYNKYDFGSYFTSSFILNEKLNLDMGIRYDYNRLDTEKFYIKSRWEERGYDEDFADIIVEDLGTQLLTNPVYNFHNLSASSGISYQFDDHNNFIFNYSLASRPPNPAELFSDGLHHSLARIELGDLRFGKEISNKFSLSYEYKKKNLQIITDLYYNNVDNFIYLAPFGVEETIRGFYPVWNYRQTDAAVYGIDTYFNYSFNEYLSLENKSSLTFGEDRKENIPLIDIPPFNTITTFSYSKPNWHNFKFSLTSELVLEQNRFPDNNLEVFIPRTEEFIILDTSTPPPAYHLLHLSIQNTFYIHNKRLVTSLFVDNVLNTSYRNYLNQMRFFADDLGRNIRLQIQFNI